MKREQIFENLQAGNGKEGEDFGRFERFPIEISSEKYVPNGTVGSPHVVTSSAMRVNL